MSEANPPIFLQGGSHNADDVRRFIASVTGDVEGIHLSTDLAVTQKSGTVDMSVDVAGGRVLIKGTVTAYQGTYHAENEGVTNLVVSASDGSNARNDLIVAEVEDTAHGGATDIWRLAVITGTPAASPLDPTVNANSYTLARVVVGAGVSTITDAAITDLRAQANPGYELVAFTASGTFEKAAYPWAKSVRVRVVGGGGGSGGCASTTASQRAESGGGGGAGYSEKRISASALSASETVTVGAGGAAGVSGNNNGGVGGTSAFGAHASGTGGNGGGGATATSTQSAAARGYRGVGVSGDINLAGGHGGNGVTTVTGASLFQSMQNWGGHAGGGMGAQSLSTQGFDSAPITGESYGGGASGGRNTVSQSAVAGAAGAVGIVIVEMFG